MIRRHAVRTGRRGRGELVAFVAVPCVSLTLGVACAAPAASDARGIAVTATNLVLGVGDSSQLGAIALGSGPASGSWFTTGLAWNSSDPAIAEVNGAGRVLARAAGRVTVTVIHGSSRDTATVWVATPPEALTATAIAAGDGFACAIVPAGETYCWGVDASGELGLGRVRRFTGTLAPVRVSTDVRFTSLTAGASHACALDAAGAAYCWGWNAYGQLGIGDEGDRARPSAVATSVRFVSLAAGAFHTCGVELSGALYCWGGNERGQLGHGSTSPSATPVRVGGDAAARYTTIAAGALHTCAVSTTGAVTCWGDGRFGQLGLGSNAATMRELPAEVLLAAPAADITAGDRHTCARLTDGSLECWGANDTGQLALGDLQGRVSPTPVPLGTQAVHDIAAGGGHTCAVTEVGMVLCWGANQRGQVGNGATPGLPVPPGGPNPYIITTPTLVLKIGAATAIALSGEAHSCAIDVESRVWCWGENGSGALGIGSQGMRDETTTTAAWVATRAVRTPGNGAGGF